MSSPYRSVVQMPKIVASRAELAEAYSGQNPKCRKCGYEHLCGTLNSYDAGDDVIERQCVSCRFKWIERPADSQ